MGLLRLAAWPNGGTFIATRKRNLLTRCPRVCLCEGASGMTRERPGVCAMDVGITKSNKQHPIHLVSGLVVVTVGYTALMFAVRALVMG